MVKSISTKVGQQLKVTLKNMVLIMQVFTPITGHDTIQLVISLATKNDWFIHQLDIKSIFLHGELSEQVYVDQPLGYTQKGEEHKVYHLQKVLYGPKQVHKAWYNRIGNYFLKVGFVKSPYKHTLFIKHHDGDKILIVCLLC